MTTLTKKDWVFFYRKIYCKFPTYKASSLIEHHIPETSTTGLIFDWLCWGLTRQPLRVNLCRLPEKGRKEIEERVEEMKERDREERGTGMKVKKQKK